ncbi:MAG TPA: uroporphyrinogen decarboxylase family protein [bacterium]|nr:uroporphyrinogen decarboxylase family protein [bacterium]
MYPESQEYRQLLSYIALGAPATRRPATGNEPFLRPELGFTPRWFYQSLGIDFSERWHIDPVYRRDSLIAMGNEIQRRFGDIEIAGVSDPNHPKDLLTGIFGACTVAATYGIDIIYAVDNWPTCAHQYLSDEQADRLEPPDLDSNPFFHGLMEQVELIAEINGTVEGYINWQGVLNNAQRLRGEELFVDMIASPERAMHLFDCVTTTMIDGAQRLYERQRRSGVDIRHFTVSNCLVNMVSPEQYRDLLLPFDRKLQQTFGLLGIHNCAWNANPYMEHYASVPNVGYIDMGIESDMARAKALFPDARRAIMYTPMDLAEKELIEIRQDLEKIAREYGPCDLVFADIDAGTSDRRVRDVVEICGNISADMEH